ncbi:MBL fold metallo-hydrolase [Angustibacter sp. Root456]|uniref:MBL fold metallo-hydrolase n=1 Tax=Angustibacter sp. Root456 TaxID=1736539 RepID=UPI000AF65EE3|nr:MBL fold metallo-hydrolase [Angustibacter sp. Root456]
MHLTLTHVGGPTTLVELGGLRLLVDPTFDPPGEYRAPSGAVLRRTAPAALTAAAVLPVDVVLLSHDQHADNLDPSGQALLAQVPVAFSTPEAAERQPAVHGLAPWERAVLERPDGGALVVTAVPARHGPEGCEPKTGTVTGFVLSGAGLPTVYVSGDNAAVELVHEIAERVGEIDVALLFAGAARTPSIDAPLTLTAADAVEAARLLGDALVVPVHADSWAHFSEGVDDVVRAFVDAGLDEHLRVLDPGVPTPLALRPL